MARLDVGDILEARKVRDASIATTRSTDRPVWLPISLVAVLLVAPALQFVGGYNYVIHMLLYVMMYSAMASSWNILGGYTGHISLGHAVFFCVGAYFSGLILTFFRISTLVTAPLAGVVVAALGFLVGLVTL